MGLQFQRVTVYNGSVKARWEAAGVADGSSHLDLQTEGKELGRNGRSLLKPTPTPSDAPPPARPHLLVLLNISIN